MKTVLSGSKRKVYAFGSSRYPGTDRLKVVINDKYGSQKSSGWEHIRQERVRVVNFNAVKVT